MLEMVFAIALMDTVIAVPSEGTVYVHEWGVVTFTEASVVIGADPDMVTLDQPFPPDHFEDMVVRAPVVYFYGEPFSGSFTVSVRSGSFLEAYPTPGDASLISSPPFSGASARASWRINGTFPGTDRDVPSVDGTVSCVSGELLELWREPPSMVLEFGDGSKEEFVYYECTMAPEDEDAYGPVILGDEGASLDPGYRGELLRFVRTGDGVEMVNGPGEDVVGTLCEWAGGSMKSQELEALWGTWEGWIYDGAWRGDTLLVFPLPLSTIDNITSIQLITDEWMDVEYSRFFLGMLSE
ncbi:MAG: hypothetical protein JXA64_05005 [Candidatus Fermentibacteraceae bacterium]|nr:hypothetical protein [Candidatus Fermentibacteraceae bacterium]MBN2608454.1 hypothetical protein [Candidatus Fermentibacteraceae bacterium]